MNIGQEVNWNIVHSQGKFCEDLCPYKMNHADYDDDYELPCTVAKCFVPEFKRYLTR